MDKNIGLWESFAAVNASSPLYSIKIAREINKTPKNIYIKINKFNKYK